MIKNKLKIISIVILLISFVDTYFLLKYENFSQLFWFCNAVIYLLAIGLYFENSILLTGILVGALTIQIPWVLDFLLQLLFGYSLFGVASYMFEYGFNSLRFYVDLDHLLIIPLAIYGIKKTGFNKHGWVFAAIVALALNAGAYAFSSQLDNVNCVFYSCFDNKISTKEHPLLYMFMWTLSISILFYIFNLIIYRILNRKRKPIHK